MKRLVMTVLVCLMLAVGTSVVQAGRTSGGDSFPGGSDLPGEGGGGGATQTTDVDNTNKNYNTNINSNKAYGGQGGQGGSAVQGQLQGQAQGQAQGIFIIGGQEGQGTPFSTNIEPITLQGGDDTLTLSPSNESNSVSGSVSNSNSNSSANNSLSINYEDKIQYGPTLNPYGVSEGSVRWDPERRRARGFVSLETFVSAVDEVEVDGLLQNRDVIREYTPFGPDKYADKFAKRVRLGMGPMGRTKVMGTMWSDDDEDSNTTAALVTEAARFCSKYGADRLFLMRQSVNADAVTSGWGLGFSQNAATINSSGVTSVSAGGTGYSRARGGHRYRIALEFACQAPE